MGSRGRSIRLRIYFLVAIPLVTMLGLFGYVAYTSVTNWRNLDRAPNLVKATSEPLTAFVTRLQNERRAAVVYLSRPTSANRSAYRAAVAATRHDEISFAATVRSPATTDNATPAETAAIGKMVAGVNGMTKLRDSAAARHLSALGAFRAYTKVITRQDAVFQAEAGSMTDTVASSQGLGLIATVNAREELSEQDALLAGALAGRALTGPERVAFNQAAGRQSDDILLYQSLLSPPELKVFNKTMDTQEPAAARNYIARVQDGVAAGLPMTALELKGLSPAAWRQAAQSWQTANYNAGTNAASAILAVDEQLANSARMRVVETAALGAAGLILTLIVSILLGQSINRRLTALRRAALTLATQQLPAVVARLRRGESVDVGAEAPPLRAGGDEIGQVGQAIDTVRQTAIRSAVEEARVRQGVNDMFRNLARRSQSLLQRQLALLDEMERRATDPDVLADLFKMDHLTTRMRRHAEGLIILSGATPGRAWSAPVKLIDVMRGAVAEVEDYARVTVSTQSRAALAGSAVTDVIHLLAELVENATTLSPPYTQVQMNGERVASGFAIEIEDRGLGMTPQRLAELNERLANPPEINPANTEQLGLFVVGQLARRHGISVTLRQSPYGGTSAIALIPAVLVVADGPPAITTGDGSLGPAPAAPASAPAPPAPPIRISGALRLTGGMPGGASTPSGMPGGASTPGGTRRGRHATGEVPLVTGVPVSPPAKPPKSTFDVFTPIQRSGQDHAAAAVPGDALYGPSYPDFGPPSFDASGEASHSGEDADDGDRNGLPRRVRQASLAPELRASAAAAAKGTAGVPPASAASLAVMRNTLSAMQRGWQQGRSQPQQDTEDGIDGD